MQRGRTRELTERLEEVVLQEIPGWVVGVDAPPVVREYVEHAEDEDEEHRAPPRLKSDGDHNASNETDDGDKDSGDGPSALDDEAEEEEDEEDTTCEEEAESACKNLQGMVI